MSEICWLNEYTECLAQITLVPSSIIYVDMGKNLTKNQYKQQQKLTNESMYKVLKAYHAPGVRVCLCVSEFEYLLT